jgi:NAD-dependent deacetylase
MHPPVDDDLEPSLDRAAALLRAARRVAVLTGAGVSAESGVPTFRDADGLWEGHAVEDVATPQAFRRDPRLVWQFYNARRANLRAVEPNAGHAALARLEERLGPAHCAVITQNVDGLHRRAGSRNVFELHGNLARTRCTGCGWVEDRGLEPLGDLPECPYCKALLRPDVVWFTEALPDDVWAAAKRAAERCDCCLVVGTSAIVYPAAGLIGTARRGGRPVIECNLARTAASSFVDVRLFGPSGQVLPRLVERVLGASS